MRKVQSLRHLNIAPGDYYLAVNEGVRSKPVYYSLAGLRKADATRAFRTMVLDLQAQYPRRTTMSVVLMRRVPADSRRVIVEPAATWSQRPSHMPWETGPTYYFDNDAHAKRIGAVRVIVKGHVQYRVHQSGHEPVFSPSDFKAVIPTLRRQAVPA